MLRLMIVLQGKQLAPQGLEIGEKLLWLFEEPHDVTKLTRSKYFFHYLIIFEEGVK